MRLLFSVALTASITLLACGGDSDEPPANTEPPATESVALGGDAAMSCVEGYSLDTLANRAFAFDGAVTHIGTEEDLLYVEVTFEVHEWFKGEGPSEVIVQMFPPNLVTSVSNAHYAVGSRLLVTGEPRWGGAPLEDPVAWYCGFSRTYDAETATSWRDTLG